MGVKLRCHSKGRTQIVGVKNRVQRGKGGKVEK